MRVCMISPHYPPDRSGVGDYTALLAHHLITCGTDVTVVTSSRPAERSMVVATDCTVGEHAVRVLPLLKDWSWKSLPRLCAVAAAGRYDIVHIQYQNVMYRRSAAVAALPLILRLIRPSARCVVTVHDYGTPWPRHVRVRALAGPYGKLWFEIMLLAASRVILTNEQDEWRFLHQRFRYPVPAARYRVIPVGSNLPSIHLSDDGAAVGPMTIGYFGFVNPPKGVDTLIDAFVLARQRNSQLRLVLICALKREDPYHGLVQRKLHDAGLQSVVTITGELNDTEAAQILARCVMVVLPYRDGISLRRTTLVAALALGRPVISTYSSVPPATLQEGRDVILVPPMNPQALAGAILELAGDPARRVALGRHAREAAQAFSWASIAARTSQLYRQLS